MEILELKAQMRQTTGKNKARQLRVKGLLPANLYGHKVEPTVLAVDNREFTSLLRSKAGSHVIVRLLLDGVEAPTVIVKEIQRDPTCDAFLHVDFMSVALDEKIVAAVPVKLIGESIGVREGGVVQHGLWDIQVEALPTDIPDHIEVDIAELNVGDGLHISDISLPDNLAMATPAEEVVVTIVPPVIYKEEVPEEEIEGEELEEGIEEGEAKEGMGEGEGESAEGSEES